MSRNIPHPVHNKAPSRTEGRRGGAPRPRRRRTLGSTPVSSARKMAGFPQSTSCRGVVASSEAKGTTEEIGVGHHDQRCDGGDRSPAHCGVDGIPAGAHGACSAARRTRRRSASRGNHELRPAAPPPQPLLIQPPRDGGDCGSGTRQRGELADAEMLPREGRVQVQPGM